MHKVVITGLGVVAPNGVGVEAFRRALRNGVSGIALRPELEPLGFACHLAGVPEVNDGELQRHFDDQTLKATNSCMQYAGLAALECWRDAGLDRSGAQTPDWNTAAIVGTGVAGIDTVGGVLAPQTDSGRVRRMGSTVAEQAMTSAMSAFIGGLLGIGGQLTTNSSACCTGSEAVLNGWRLVQQGVFPRVLAGSTEGCSAYTWACFDAMRVTARNRNADPSTASRPLSATAAGFVPAAGAGMLMLETLESARARGVRIYAELPGGFANCGGQRNGGSITASNPEGVRRCIAHALAAAQVAPGEIDYINGHLTATGADSIEVENLVAALGRDGDFFPWLNSTKCLIGHGLGAAGAMEAVATVLQLADGFVHPSLNSEDLHPKIERLRERIPLRTVEAPIRTALKTSFGFGDVNTCLILRRWRE